MKAPYDEEGEKVVTRGGGRNCNDRTMGICMLVGAAPGITYASVLGIGSIVGLTPYYFRGRS